MFHDALHITSAHAMFCNMIPGESLPTHWRRWYHTTALVIRPREGAVVKQQKCKSTQQGASTVANRQPLAPVIDLTDDNQPDNKRLCI